MLDDVQTITAFACDIRDYLRRSDHTEYKAFIRLFVREVAVAPGEATIRYAIPLPAGNRHTQGHGSRISARGSWAWGLRSSAMPPNSKQRQAPDCQLTARGKVGRPDWKKSRTGTPSLVTPSAGIGTVYVSVAFRSGNVPRCNKARKSRTYPVISAVPGSSTFRCANWCSVASRAAGVTS